MRIAQIAPQVESVPPKGYGGSELVVSELTEELVKRGHDVTLFASGDSFTSARLISTAPQGLRKSQIAPTRWPAYELAALLKLEQMAGEFDLIHNHLGYLALPILRELQGSTLRIVTTLHNPIKEYCRAIYMHYKELPYIAVSDAYRKSNHPRDLNYVATIYNGIDLGKFPFYVAPSRNFLLSIGRICHDKGSLEAIEIAQRLDLPIVLAGKIDNNDKEYFEQWIRPKLASPNVNFIGEVNGLEKSRLYSSAIATVCPINFEEPFGLVLAESLAAGTPVMALRHGAVPEIITDGETGIVADSIEELIFRYGEVAKLSRMNCRKRAEALFSKEKMAEEYEELYKKLQDNVFHATPSIWEVRR